MPLEPNKKIDDLLRRYVKQRREESRADFELHPATRKLLQGEVTRVFATNATETKPRLFVTLWPRLALAGAFTAMFIVAVLMLNTPQKSKSALELSLNSQKEIAEAPAQLKTFAEQIPASQIVADKSDFAKKEAAPSSVATPSAKEPAPTRRIAGESGIEVAKQSRAERSLSKSLDQSVPLETRIDGYFDRVAAVTNSAQSFSGAANETANVPLGLRSAPTVAATRSANAESLNRWRFVQQDLRAKYRQNLVSPTQPKILQSFEIARVGNKIQLFDADGSVYEGEILASDKDKLVEEDALMKNKQTSKFAFRVFGTNQQLNRTVTFTGEFAFTNANLALGGKLPAKANDVFQAGEFKGKSEIVGNGFIQGKVSIGGTNEFEIQATEAPR